jgi:hypothetical protein
MRTSEGNDALAWVNRKGENVTQSQLAILRAAACSSETLCRKPPGTLSIASSAAASPTTNWLNWSSTYAPITAYARYRSSLNQENRRLSARWDYLIPLKVNKLT